MASTSILVRTIGHTATLIQGDTLVLDRWLWLKDRLPMTRGNETLLDVGCGSGAFTIGAAKRGYVSLGLSWDERNQRTAAERARLLGAANCSFAVCDVRDLDAKAEYVASFDVVINCENMEHVIDDRKLMRDIVRCLKPGGRLLLTTPYFHYKPMTQEDIGPFSRTEDGGHVRRGYLKSMLTELCSASGLMIEEVTFCSGFFSQRTTALLRRLSAVNHPMGWILTLPLRPLVPILDRFIGSRHYSICVEAYKPRF